jgi:hypothetical protein
LAYIKGDTYIWSDGENLHLWADNGLDDWRDMLQYADKPNASGVQIPESVIDQFVMMRFAELIKLGQASQAKQTALANHDNFGCDALKEYSRHIQRFIDDIENQPV